MKPRKVTVPGVLGRALSVRVLGAGRSGYLLETDQWVEPWHDARLETSDGRYWDDVTIAWCRTTATATSDRAFRAHAQCHGRTRHRASLTGILRRRGKPSSPGR
jgi:hypothetical protein